MLRSSSVCSASHSPVGGVSILEFEGFSGLIGVREELGGHLSIIGTWSFLGRI